MIKKATPRGGRRRKPTFLTVDAIIALHAESIAAFGGETGIRDAGGLESVMARCRTRWEYEPKSTIAELAGAIGFGLAMNHPFMDGNKRITLIAVVAFLDRNGHELTAGEIDAYATFLGVAAGKVSEDALAAWITSNSAQARGFRGPGRP